MQAGDGNSVHAVPGRRVDPALKYLYREESVKGFNGQSGGIKTVLVERKELPDNYRQEGRGGVPEMGPPSVQRMASRGENGASERFNSALANVTEMGQSLDSLQRLLLGKAVYVDEEVFSNATAVSQQTRTTKAQERRVRALERELDAAVAAAGHARAEKKQAQAAQRAAEARTQEVLKELEDTTQVFKLHAEELRLKQEDVGKKDSEIKVLQAIIETIQEGHRGRKTS